MAVPYTFGNATTSIPLSQLDTNFATAITIGNTAVYLGNTTTSFGNVTLTNVTISSGNATVTKITAPTHDAGSGNALTLQSNSTTGLYIDTSQNVGIGTSSPAYKLDVQSTNSSTASFARATGQSVVKIQGISGSSVLGFGDGTAIGNTSLWAIGRKNSDNSFRINYNEDSLDTTNYLTINTSGNVGIGTSSPANKFNVVDANTSGDDNIGNVYIRTTDSYASANVGGKLTLGGFYNATSNYAFAGIAGRKENATLNNVAGYLQFLTTTSGGALTERMRIDSSGNVGIGTTTNYQMNNTSTTPKQMIAMTNNTGLNILRYNGFGGNGAFINLGASGGASLGTYSGAVANSGLGSINFGGDNGTNYNGNGAQIYAAASETWTTSTNAGYLVFLTTSSGSVSPAERMRIDSSGNLLVGTTSSSLTSGVGIKLAPSATAPFIDVVGSSSVNSDINYIMYSTGASAYRFYVGFGGTIYATSTTISGISDQRLKENIADLDVGLDAIMALKPRKFDWKKGKGKDIKNDRGFIAQEFETVFPDLIDEWKDPSPEGEEPYKAVRADLIPVLVKAIQELKAELDALKGTK